MWSQYNWVYFQGTDSTRFSPTKDFGECGKSSVTLGNGTAKKKSIWNWTSSGPGITRNIYHWYPCLECKDGSGTCPLRRELEKADSVDHPGPGVQLCLSLRLLNGTGCLFPNNFISCPWEEWNVPYFNHWNLGFTLHWASFLTYYAVSSIKWIVQPPH